MTFQIIRNKSRMEYIKKQEAEIITILGFNLDTIEDLSSLLRKLELLAKRTKIKEIWIPWKPTGELKSDLSKLGYKKAILGQHETSGEVLEGFKKLT